MQSHGIVFTKYNILIYFASIFTFCRTFNIPLLSRTKFAAATAFEYSIICEMEKVDVLFFSMDKFFSNHDCYLQSPVYFAFFLCPHL